MKKSTIILALIAVMAVAAGWQFLGRPLEVKVTRPQKRAVVEMVIASGRLRAIRQSELGTEVAGMVELVYVDNGDQVRAGQMLIALRQADAQWQAEQSKMALETAKSEFVRTRRGPLPEEVQRARSEIERLRSARELAERDFERAVQLKDKGVLALAEWQRARSALDQARAAEQSAEHTLALLLRQPLIEDLRVAEARVREAEAAVRLTEERLRQRMIRAPSDGLIIKRQVEPGQSVVPGNALLVLSHMDHTEIYVETDENNLRKLRPGQQALVVAPSYQDRPFRATLVQIGPDVDHKRGIVGLKLRPESLPDYARPDMTMDVNIEVARFPEALSLPATSVLEIDGASCVLEVQEGRTINRQVTILGRSADWVAIAGISAESHVVVRASETKPGQSVRPKEIL
jgi:HlyD family secretion protein